MCQATANHTSDKARTTTPGDTCINKSIPKTSPQATPSRSHTTDTATFKPPHTVQSPTQPEHRAHPLPKTLGPPPTTTGGTRTNNHTSEKPPAPTRPHRPQPHAGGRKGKGQQGLPQRARSPQSIPTAAATDATRQSSRNYHHTRPTWTIPDHTNKHAWSAWPLPLAPNATPPATPTAHRRSTPRNPPAHPATLPGNPTQAAARPTHAPPAPNPNRPHNPSCTTPSAQGSRPLTMPRKPIQTIQHTTTANPLPLTAPRPEEHTDMHIHIHAHHPGPRHTGPHHRHHGRRQPHCRRFHEGQSHLHRHHAAATAYRLPSAPPNWCHGKQKPPAVRKRAHAQRTPSTTAAKQPSPTAPMPKIPPPQPACHTWTSTPTLTLARTHTDTQRRKHSQPLPPTYIPTPPRAISRTSERQRANDYSHRPE